MRLLGKKNPLRTKLGYKVGEIANKIGKKALSTIDTVAPMAAMAFPEAAPAILAAQGAAHGADRAIRSGVAVANPRRGESSVGNAIQFGRDVDSARQQNERLKRQTELLRQ